VKATVAAIGYALSRLMKQSMALTIPNETIDPLTNDPIALIK
jgi:hypothetical protein